MAKVKTTGLTETIKMLESLNKNTDELMTNVVKEGAGAVADEMRSELKGLKTTDEKPKSGKRYARPKDVRGLLDSMGFAPVKDEKSAFNSNVGFRGYNSDKTEKYPNGHPNKMIANAINKGTSFMAAQPFINRTKRKAEGKCVEKMQKKLDEEIKKIVK